MFDYTLSFDFDEKVELDDCVCWYFTGSDDIINELFPDKYPEAMATELSIEKYPNKDGYSVSISPTMKCEDGTTDYDWYDIELCDNTISELIRMAESYISRKIKSITELNSIYNVIGDDKGIVYGAYENLINLYNLAPEDAEQIVYEEMRFEVDLVAKNFQEAMNWLIDNEYTPTSYSELNSGKIAIWCD